MSVVVFTITTRSFERRQTKVKNVIQVEVDGAYITITKRESDYELSWTDGVANEWVEFYPLLSLALARFATLVACAESDWGKTFVNDNNDFVLNASLFLESEAR
jgi:hypothetical protein